MAEWELTVQHESGGFPGHFVDRAHPPVVFNTGQVIFGLLAAYETSADSRFLVAAQRAGAWLMDVQAPDGAWRRFDYRDVVHAYNTRTAWALAELGLATGERALVAAATRHLDWACDQQRPNGWIRRCGFGRGEDPYLHTIAYAAQGLLEAGLRLDRPEYVTAGQHVCQAVLDRVAPDGSLPATFDETWRPTARYSCLTGNAQIALQWLRLHAILGDPEYLVAARRVLTLLKRLQDCRTSNPNIRGALPGSYPIWGRYLFGTYPNWAVKFFMDALMAEDAVRSGEGKCIRCW